MIIHRHTTPPTTPLDKESARRRDLYLKRHNIKKRDVLAPGGIRTRSPKKQVAAETRLRRRVHRDRLIENNARE